MITPDKHHDIVFTFCILAGCMVPMGTCKLINEDSSSSLNSSRYVDEETVTKSALDSLEKYRPCNYDIGPARGEGDDINDICDYYSRLATRQRALRRVQDFNRPDQVRNCSTILVFTYWRHQRFLLWWLNCVALLVGWLLPTPQISTVWLPSLSHLHP